MHFKRDRYVCGKQNKFGKVACSENFRPVESVLIKSLLDDINNLYFSNLSEKLIGSLVDKQLTNFEAEFSVQGKQENITSTLDKLNKRKKKAIDLLLDESIDKDAYDLLMAELNPQIDQLKAELTPSIIARFINKIIVKADGHLEVHYRTSKPSAFYVSTNIKLDIPKSHPNKAYVEKHA